MHIRTPLFTQSTVSNTSSPILLDTSSRSSSSADLPPEDPVALCIAHRAAAFQGHIPLSRLESLQLVRYKPGQEYKFHNDWDDGSSPGEMRSSTFFVYVGCEDCEGGSTRFYYPKLEGLSKKWCDVIDCLDAGRGVKFLPVEGYAVFWENLDRNGLGREELLHAGTPLLRGVKYGLNIWTREKTNA